MPVKWLMIILMTAMIVTPISMIIDKAYLDSQPMMAGGKTSVIDKLLGTNSVSKADLTAGSISDFTFGWGFLDALMDITTCNYAFLNMDGPTAVTDDEIADASVSDPIKGWFRTIFILLNACVLFAVGAAIVRGVASS
jgi:hypothetical protein